MDVIPFLTMILDNDRRWIMGQWTMVDSEQWWTMDNDGQGKIVDNLNLLTMVDDGQWWTMDNGGRWTMVNDGQWWTMDNVGQWWTLTMVDNGQWWTI